MIGDSLNLVEMIRGYIPAGFNDKIASVMGESRDKTQLGMNAAIPGILSGLTSAASTPEGARRLSEAVDNSDEDNLANPGGLLGRLSSSASGSGLLSSILGSGGHSELTGGIERTSGLSGGGVKMLLGFVVPLIMGALKGIKRTKGLDAGGLSSLLASQRSNFAAAMPESMPGRIGETAERASYVREPLRDVSYRGTEPRERTTSGSRSWVLPLVVLLGLLGLLWYWGTRPSTHAGYEPRSASERAPRSGSSSSLQALTMKYQSVIDQAQAQGVRISSLGEQNGKLVIRGTAPSLEAANNVWNAIKKINPAMDDIVAELPVLSPM
jgi:Bacterial protein of unknown function (DUF937)